MWPRQPDRARLVEGLFATLADSPSLLPSFHSLTIHLIYSFETADNYLFHLEDAASGAQPGAPNSELSPSL
jgi:hypothetical protein